MVVAVVFATATSAYAFPAGGTVYGEATMQPTVAISISGVGSDVGTPLIYNGAPGIPGLAENGAELVVTNEGDASAMLYLGYGSSPTNGVDSWKYTTEEAEYPGDGTACAWLFAYQDPVNAYDAGTAIVPPDGTAPQFLYGTQQADPYMRGFTPGTSVPFHSFFMFPADFHGGTYNMQALIIADTL
jgi:hypothetical protein